MGVSFGVVLAVLIVALPGGGLLGPTGHDGVSRSAAVPGALAAALRPMATTGAVRPSLGYGSLGETYVLDNSSLIPGIYSNPYNVVGATLAVVDPSAGAVFVAGPTLSEVAEVSLSTGRVNRTFDLAAPATAILLIPGSDALAVAEGPAGNVSVLDTSSGHLLATFDLAPDPAALAYDSANQMVYIAYRSSDSVGAFNATTFGSAGLLTGSFAGADALAVDPSAELLYVADRGAADVSVVDTASGSVTATWPVGSGPDTIAYFAAAHAIFVGNEGSENITVRNATSGALVGTIALLFGPEEIVGDPAVGFLYVDNTTDTTIDIVNSESDVVEGVLAGYNGAAAIALDPTTDRLYVAESVTNNLTVVAAATNSILGEIRIGWSPNAVAYDTATGALAFTTPDTDRLDLVNATTGAPIHSFVTGLNPTAALYDPVSECIYVTNANSDTVTVVNGSSLAVAATIPVGVAPEAMALVAAYDYIFVANAAGTLTILNAGTNQAVGSITLPVSNALSGIAYDAADGDLYVGSGASVEVVGALNHTDWRSIATPQAVGTIVSDDYASVVYALSSPSTSAVHGNVTEINATANAAATNYSVPDALGGADYDARNGVVYVSESAAAGDLLAFNGTSGSLLGTVAGGLYNGPMTDSAGRGGVFGVQTATGTISIVTLPGLGDYLVNVTETGLPIAQSWSVTFGGHTTVASTTAWLTTVAPDGALSYTVGTVAGYAASPSNGSIVVDGRVAIAAIQFARLPPRFAVNFAETGLLSGTNWSVTCNGTTQNTTGLDLTFLVGNGSIAYTVGPVAGYSVVSGGSGTVAVAGRPVTVNITFEASSTSSKGTTGSSGLGLGAAGGYLLAALGALVGGVAGALVGRRGRPVAPPAEETSGAGTAPEAPVEGDGSPPAAGPSA